MNTGWVILLIVLALLYGFVIIGHSAAKHLRKKTQDEVPDEPPATGKVRKPYISDEQMRELMEAALRRIKKSEKRAEEARAALDGQLAKEYGKNNHALFESNPKPEYRWEERDGSHYLIYEGRPKPSFSARTWGDIKDSVAEGEAFGIPVRDGSLGYVISGLVAPAAGTLFVFIYGKRGLNPGDEIAMIDPDPEAAGELEIYMEQIRGRERAEDEKRRREERERREKREKEEMARKIMKREHRRKLEKEVRQELIDSGELFGDEPKRPPIPREVVDAVYRRDGGRCVYCGSTEDLQIDHIIPFSKGGSSELANLQLLCRKCNIEKSNKIG